MCLLAIALRVISLFDFNSLTVFPAPLKIEVVHTEVWCQLVDAITHFPFVLRFASFAGFAEFSAFSFELLRASALISVYAVVFLNE